MPNKYSFIRIIQANDNIEKAYNTYISLLAKNSNKEEIKERIAVLTRGNYYSTFLYFLYLMRYKFIRKSP